MNSGSMLPATPFPWPNKSHLCAPWGSSPSQPTASWPIAPAGTAATSRLVWFDRQGNSKGVLGPAGLYRGVAVSPDGNKVAVARDDPQSTNSNIWILDERGVPSRFTLDPARQTDPVWSSNGSIMFSSAGRTQTPGIFQKDYGKGGKEELMVSMGTPIRANDWSPDGRYVLFATSDPKTKGDLWTLPTGLQRNRRKSNTGAVPPDPVQRKPGTILPGRALGGLYLR